MLYYANRLNESISDVLFRKTLTQIEEEENGKRLENKQTPHGVDKRFVTIENNEFLHVE